MISKYPAVQARRLNHSPRRVAAHALSSLARALQKAIANRLPYRLSTKLEQVAGSTIPVKAFTEKNASKRRSSARYRPQAKRILLVSHDLSMSGAPILLFEIGQTFLNEGWHVTLISPSEGPLINRIRESKIDVVIDGSTGWGKRQTWVALAQTADAVICNTVATRDALESFARSLPCLWYLHEVSLIEQMLVRNDGLPEAFRRPALLWAGSEVSAQLVRPYRPDVRVVPYGLSAINPVEAPAIAVGPDRCLQLIFLGSYEPRKGQDLLLEAVRLLPAGIRQQCRITMFGRVLDRTFYTRLLGSAEAIAEITISGELSREDYERKILSCDAVIVASRDDTLPLVSLDALGAGRVLMCTATTGTSAYLQSGINGFVAAQASPSAIAAMLTTAVQQRVRWPTIGAQAIDVFNTFFSKRIFENALLEALNSITGGCEARE